MEHIKITDLCVGDWVMYDLKPYIVQQIDGESEHVVISGSEGVRDKHIDYIEPICIKPEMLEKNGLKAYSDMHNSWKFDISDNIRVWMFKDSYVWAFQVMSYGLGYNHCVAKVFIRHIHQLQNALRLAGIDKEIEL